MQSKCVDQVVGNILAGWRYDISGIAAEMRADYEQHFSDCAYCRGKQRLHRTIDIGLIIIASLSAAIFLLAFGVIHRLSPKHAILLEIIALGGFLFSTVMWIIVAVSTPAPMVVAYAARSGARRVHERLPEKIRERLPQELTEKIIG